MNLIYQAIERELNIAKETARGVNKFIPWAVIIPYEAEIL